MARSKTVLLLGGTGAMGVYLAPELLELGYNVHITSRSSRSSNHKNLEYIQGDAKNDTFLKSLLKDNKYDAVVDFMVYHTDEFQQRVDLLLKNTEHYLFLSSYRVYAGSDKPLTEKSPRLLDAVNDERYLKTDEYGLTKARQEDILKNSNYKHWTVVRPAITYSKTRFQLGTMEANEFLHRVLSGKEVIFPKEMLDKKTTMTWAGDVAQMIASLVLNPKTYSETYTVSTSESHTWREVIDIYKNIVNLNVRHVSLADYERVIGRHYQIKYDRMYNRTINNKKILTATGLKQKDLMSLKEGLKIELENFIKKPEFGKIDRSKDREIDNLISPPIISLGIAKKIKNKLRRVKRFVRSRQEADGAILSLGGYYNYGGLIQRYALQTFTRKNGYNLRVFNLRYMNKFGKREGDRRNLEQFAQKYIDQETFHPWFSAFYGTYIVGSDQVWRDWFGGDWSRFGNFFLRFVKNKKAKRIAYSASFGVDDLYSAGINARNKKKIVRLIKKFDAISVRENSAVRLVEQLKGKATTCLDPSLLLTKDDYSRLIDQSSAVREVEVLPVFSYLLDPTEAKEDVVKSFGEANKTETTNIRPRNGKRLPPMELWLKCFRDSEIIITDSFHGAAFSIINRKKFIVIGNKTRGLARMTDLLEPLGLGGRLISEDDLDTLELSDLMKPIDWEKVEKILNDRIKDSSTWLLSALEN